MIFDVGKMEPKEASSLIRILARRYGLFIGLSLLWWSVAAPAEARAEWYVAAQAGAQVPQDLSNIQGTGSFTGVTSNDLNLRTQFAYGVKAGYFFSQEEWSWLGAEFEFYHSDANIERQGITATAPILGATQQNGFTPRVGLTTNNMVFNVILRYPGERVQPYVGVGGGLGHSLLRTAPSDQTAFYPVLNMLVGVKFLVTNHVGLFTEYKHTSGTPHFSETQFEADLRTNWFMAGVAYHF